ncbi:MAG: sigma-70 family RNA polymerase sigma factor [Oscillospiraceae bacterium]|nr:sigma-70 family RNA polymerase sigma factor [Oscillospiraceae bacterium]
MIDKLDFAARVEKKSETLYRVARTILKNDEDCKDVLQETVLRAWENRGQLRDTALFSTWITRILINECHTLARRKRKYLLSDTVDVGAISNAPDLALQLALEGLPEKLRLPLVLHYLEGYTYEQVARMLRIPQATVRGRLSRARAALRMEIDDEQEAQY